MCSNYINNILQVWNFVLILSTTIKVDFLNRNRIKNKGQLGTYFKYCSYV